MASMSPSDAVDPMQRAWRCVAAGVLVGWLSGFDGLVRDYRVYLRVTVDDPFFPALLTSNSLLALAFAAPVIVGVIALVRPRPRTARLHAAVLFACSLLLVLHRGSFGLQRFTTCLWVGAWMLWLASRWGRDAHAEVVAKSTMLGRLILALVMLGAASGKWTAAYWNGEAFHELIFARQPYATFVRIRAALDPDQLMTLARWYGRTATSVETAFPLLVLALPRYAALAVACLLLIGMWLLGTPKIIDAVAPLMGLGAACLVLAGGGSDHPAHLRRPGAKRAGGAAPQP